MNAIFSTSLSGMNAAQAALDTTAHNIANLGTPGFKRQQVEQSELPTGGTSTQVIGAAAAGESLKTDLVGQLQAKNAFLANLAVFRAGDNMMGALLDVMG